DADGENRLLVLRALGGFGKSALAWHWLLHDVEPARWPRVAWWSFYESAAGFDSFLRDTLEYLGADPRGLGPRQQADELLRRLPGIRGKVLMTTRLRPRVLESHGGDTLAGCREVELTQMQPADAVAFFRAQGVRGGRAEIEAACARYGYHPLSLRLLAGLV